MAAVQRGEVDVIIVYKLGRLWRNRRERTGGIKILRKHEVSVLCVKGPELDLKTAAGRLLAGLLGEVDTFDVEQMSEREQREMRQRVERGLPPAGRAASVTADGAELVEDEGRRGRGLLSRAARRSAPLRYGRRPQRAGHPQPQRQLGPRFEHGGVEPAGGRDRRDDVVKVAADVCRSGGVRFLLGPGRWRAGSRAFRMCWMDWPLSVWCWNTNLVGAVSRRRLASTRSACAGAGLVGGPAARG